MTEELKPLLDRVLVRPAEPVSAGGIVMADKVAPDRGVVLAVGPGKPERKMALKVGDKVLFDPVAGPGTKIKLNGEELLVFYEIELIGVLK